MRSFSDHDLVEHLTALRRFAFSLTRTEHAAEDLVQDTLERALARADSFHEGTNLRAWLFTICRNHFISNCRRLSNQNHIPIEDAMDHMAVAADQTRYVEMRDLTRCFDQLSETDRDVISMVALEGLSYDDAARRLKIEVGTVKSRLSRARSRLQNYMSASRQLPRAA